MRLKILRSILRANLSAVLPISQLLRSASSWEQCNAEPFAVPPQQQWEAVASVLRLLQFLESSGVLSGHIVVYSGYRNPTLNACAGGAVGSAHARSFALDIRVLGSVGAAEALCNFWRMKGKEWNMGFSIYPRATVLGAMTTLESRRCAVQPNQSPRLAGQPAGATILTFINSVS